MIGGDSLQPPSLLGLSHLDVCFTGG